MVLERFKSKSIDEDSKQAAILSYLSSGNIHVAEFGLSGVAPISAKDLKHILREKQIVEVAKDESLFGKLIQFFGKIVSENVTIRRTSDLVGVRVEMPLTFGVPIKTIEQVLVNIIKRITTKEAVGLIITPEDDDRLVLIGRQHSLLDMSGDAEWTIPATTANPGEDIVISQLRALQHEALFPAAFRGDDLIELLCRTPPTLIARVNVGDHRASTYHLRLSRRLLDEVGTPKLGGLGLRPVGEILSMGKRGALRPGGYEVGKEYSRWLTQGEGFIPARVTSELNERVIRLSRGFDLAVL